MFDQDSFSGSLVAVETILWLNTNLACDRMRSRKEGFFMFENERLGIRVPQGHLAGGVSPEIYNGYRKGLESACIDMVITTELSNGVPAVIASKRADNKPFGGTWFMYGGALHSYRSITEFIMGRVLKESGLTPKIEGLIGFFRTCAEDFLASTMQLCFVGYVPYYECVEQMKSDRDHTECKFFTFEDIVALPISEQHWYPMLVFQQALLTMPA